MKRKLKDFIVDPRGQYNHPGKKTYIPNAKGSITMRGVPYPVLGIDDQGNQQMMYPDQEYQFPGNGVYEIPMAQTGLQTKKDPNLLYQEYLKLQEEVNQRQQEEKSYEEKLYNTLKPLDNTDVTKSGFIPKNILEWRNPKNGHPAAFCISGVCYALSENGEPIKYYSNTAIQNDAKEGKIKGRYLDQSEKGLKSGDILQFKYSEGMPYHAFLVTKVNEPDEKGNRKVDVFGNHGGGWQGFHSYYLDSKNKIFNIENDKNVYKDTQVIKREVNPRLHQSIIDRDNIKKQLEDIYPLTFKNLHIDTDTFKPTAFTTNENENIYIGDPESSVEAISLKDSKINEILNKFSDPTFKKDFMKKQQVSTDEYDAIVKNVMGIYGAESKFGTGYGREPIWLQKFLAGPKGIKSVGPFQINPKMLQTKRFSRNDLFDPILGSEAAATFLAENLPLLRSRAKAQPGDKNYSENLNQDNYLEFLPYLMNQQGLLKGDEYTKEKKPGKLARLFGAENNPTPENKLTGDSEYNQKVKEYIEKLGLEVTPGSTSNVPEIKQMGGTFNPETDEFIGFTDALPQAQEGLENKKLPTYNYANKEGIIGGPTEVKGGTRVPVSTDGLPVVNLREVIIPAYEGIDEETDKLLKHWANYNSLYGESIDDPAINDRYQRMRSLYKASGNPKLDVTFPSPKHMAKRSYEYLYPDDPDNPKKDSIINAYTQKYDKDGTYKNRSVDLKNLSIGDRINLLSKTLTSPATYNPFFNEVNYISSVTQLSDTNDKLVAELSHAYQQNKQDRNLVFEWIDEMTNNPAITHKEYAKKYKNPNTYEYNAHSVIEPRMQEYLNGKISLEELHASFNKKARGGSLQKAQLGGSRSLNNIQPTRQDSLMLYNNALEKIKFYSGNPDYKKQITEGTDFKDRSTRTYMIKRSTSATDKVDQNLIDQIDRNAKAANKPLTPLEASKLKLKFGKVKFGKVPGTNLTSFGDILNSEPDDHYNPLAPSIYLHPNIQPQGSEKYFSRRFGDTTEIPYYDPIAIAPFNILNDKQKVERVKKYGPKGVPKSYLNPESVPTIIPRNTEQLEYLKLKNLINIPTEDIKLNLNTSNSIYKEPFKPSKVLLREMGNISRYNNSEDGIIKEPYKNSHEVYMDDKLGWRKVSPEDYEMYKKQYPGSDTPSGWIMNNKQTGGSLKEYQKKGQVKPTYLSPEQLGARQVMQPSTTSVAPVAPKLQASQYYAQAQKDINNVNLTDDDFREKYGTNKHTWQMKTNPQYKAQVEAEAIELAKRNGTIDLPSSNMFSKSYAGNPNLNYMVPNGLTGDARRNYEQSQMDVVGAVLPIPGLQQMGRIPSIGQALGTETGLLSNVYKINPWAERLNDANKSYRVAGLDAFEDFKNTGILRSQRILPENATFLDRVAARTTGFPSFQKGYADMAYAPKEGAVIFETGLPTFKRGEINPVTGRPIKGSHYAHRVINPETGATMSQIPGKDIRVFNDKPNWLMGYKPIEVPNLNVNSNIGFANVKPNPEQLKDAYGFLRRRQFIKELQKQGLIGKNFEDLNYAARSTDKTNALTKLALEKEATRFRGVEGSVPKSGKGTQEYTGYNFDMSKPAWGNEISEFENMINAGVDFNDPISIAKYQAVHIPMEQYGYRSGMPTMKNVDALYTGSYPTGYGKYMFKLKSPRDFSTGNYQDWFNKYHNLKSRDFNKLAVKDGYYNTSFIPENSYDLPVLLDRNSVVGKKGQKMFDIDESYPYIDYKNLSKEQQIEYNKYVKKLKEDWNTGWKGQYKIGGSFNPNTDEFLSFVD